MTYAGITSWGTCMPPAALTNSDLCTFVDMTGSSQSRHWIRAVAHPARRDRSTGSRESPEQVASIAHPVAHDTASARADRLFGSRVSPHRLVAIAQFDRAECTTSARVIPKRLAPVT